LYEGRDLAGDFIVIRGLPGGETPPALPDLLGMKLLDGLPNNAAFESLLP